MMPPFDLDTAARHGTNPVRMLAFYLALAVREGADRLTFNHAFTPGATGSAIECSIDGICYGLIPPPNVVFRKLIRLLHDLVGPAGCRFTARLGGHEFVVQAGIGPLSANGFSVLDVPVMPSVLGRAEELLVSNQDADGFFSIDFNTAELV